MGLFFADIPDTEEAIKTEKWRTDEDGISYIDHGGLLTGLPYVIRQIARRLKVLSTRKLVLLPDVREIGRRNRPELEIASFKVGHHYDKDDKEHYKFRISIQLTDFGSEATPDPWERIVHAFDCTVGSVERMVTLRCFTPEGYYIGGIEEAMFLYGKLGLDYLEPIGDDKHTVQVGWCEKEQKWYGWSHRAYYGFGIGDVVEEGSTCSTPGSTDEWIAEHPEEDLSLPVGFVAETLEDARLMATAHAESVG